MPQTSRAILVNAATSGTAEVYDAEERPWEGGIPGRHSAADRSTAPAAGDRGCCSRSRCRRNRRSRELSISNGTAAGQARTLAHPRGFEAGPPVGFVHLFLPGPTTAVTPFFGFPGEGLDVEPSPMTNFKGFTAFAVLAGHAEGSDGKTYNVEFDLRVMEGEYQAQDGSHHRGAFGFF